MKLTHKTALSAALAAAIMFTLTAGAFCEDSKEKVPVINIEKKIVDVGTIYEERDVSHEFPVENRGDAELHILRIKAG
jgi:hypothetical protein